MLYYALQVMFYRTEGHYLRAKNITPVSKQLKQLSEEYVQDKSVTSVAKVRRQTYELLKPLEKST